jgi:hypothetical protein
MGEISLLSIVIGIVVLIINIILVVNIIKAGKYAELTYKLIERHLNKLNEAEPKQIKQELDRKNFNKSIHDVWSEIQNKNE